MQWVCDARVVGVVLLQKKRKIHYILAYVGKLVTLILNELVEENFSH